MVTRSARCSILGISAYYHDAAACLVRDGEIVAAAQEERFTRKKHDSGFPQAAIAYCLREGGIPLNAVDYVAFYDKPLVKFERLLSTYLAYAPKGLSSYLKGMPIWLKEKLNLASLLRKHLDGYKGELLFGDHHESHAASAFYPSPFNEAAVLTIDGVGEWATASYGVGRGRELTLLKQMKFPHSVGLLYSAFTAFTGFKVNSGEYKLMGLAPYGEPKYVDLIRSRLVDIKEDGSVRLNLEYFTFPYALQMTGEAFEELFGGPARRPESPITQREMDIARSIQEVVEEAVLRMTRHVHRETGMSNLCMSGGVALNCVANGRVLRERLFKRLWIQPAAGDAGGALGVALAVYHRHLGYPRYEPQAGGNGQTPNGDRMKGSLLGPAYSSSEIQSFLKERGIASERLKPEELPGRVARLIAAEKVVGLMQGRMEFGPRALGCRSIIGDARSPRMQSVMNLKIKYRESFRPFAPSVLREHVGEYFELDEDSPYMLLVAPVREERRLKEQLGAQKLSGIERLKVPRSIIPAVTHVDYSARIQTVRREDNPLYYDIIRAFYDLTSCPVIVNTSFNVRGEPIVCTPEDAYRCFMRTEMDYLLLEDFLLDKQAQATAPRDLNWEGEFPLD